MCCAQSKLTQLSVLPESSWDGVKTCGAEVAAVRRLEAGLVEQLMQACHLGRGEILGGSAALHPPLHLLSQPPCACSAQLQVPSISAVELHNLLSPTLTMGLPASPLQACLHVVWSSDF